MDGRVQAKVDQANRVLEFLRSHPAWQAGFGSGPAVLEELVARAATLETRRCEAAVAERDAMAERRVILESLRRMAGHVSRFDGAVSKRPGALLSGDGTDEAHLVMVKAMLDVVKADRERLVHGGMSESLPEQLTTAIARLEAVIENGRSAYRQQGEARAELWAVAAQICSEVRLIDGTVRYRVWGDPSGRASWERVMRGRGWSGDVAPAA
jgi:hypothetical protein